MEYAIITDNEIRVSGYTYDNLVGSHYTFPHKYKSWLKAGTNVIYYKSKEQPNETTKRLTHKAHYFGVARVESVHYIGKQGNNKMYVAHIIDYHPFDKPVFFRLQDGSHYEYDTTDWDKQSWRNGVRKIDKIVYDRIIQDSKINIKSVSTPIIDENTEDEDYSTLVFEEGKPIRIYTTKYERNSQIRAQVIKKKGTTCCVCEMNFEAVYGELGKDYIHVHHNKPLATGKRKSNSSTDFDVVCPNCHAMLHRQKGRCLSVDELRHIMKK